MRYALVLFAHSIFLPHGEVLTLPFRALLLICHLNGHTLLSAHLITLSAKLSGARKTQLRTRRCVDTPPTTIVCSINLDVLTKHTCGAQQRSGAPGAFCLWSAGSI